MEKLDNEFEIGDVVELKSGSVRMTVSGPHMVFENQVNQPINNYGHNYGYEQPNMKEHPTRILVTYYNPFNGNIFTSVVEKACLKHI